MFDFEDINECDTGNNTCTTAQVCFNFQGGFTCLDPLQCHSPYIEVSDKWVFYPMNPSSSVFLNNYVHSHAANSYILLNWNSHSVPLRSQCMCSAENPACRDKPFTILYRHMDLSSGRSVPADIFQMQATTRYPGAFYIFQIKSGNEGREFYMRVSISGMNTSQHWAFRYEGEETWGSHDILCWNVTSRRLGGIKSDILVTYININIFMWQTFSRTYIHINIGQ